MKQFKLRNILSLAACLLLLSACGTSKPTKFYYLDSVKEANIKALNSKKLMIGVDTVSVAGYIERPQIVTLSGDTEMVMSEYNRWAEPLAHSVQRVIADNLSLYLKNAKAKAIGLKSQDYDYVVLVELNKFDGRFGEKAQLDAWWSITGKDRSFKVIREHTYLEAPVGTGYDDLVQTENDLLSQLSAQIAARLSKL